jgi:hypothetical protein
VTPTNGEERELVAFRSLDVFAALLLCGCAFIGAACGGSDTTTTTYLIDTSVTTPTESYAGTVATTETTQLYPVRVDGKWGFIDNTGTTRIEPRFDGVRVPWLWARPEVFSEGLTPVAIGQGNEARWGYIDTTGAWVIEPRFGHAGGFSEGMAVVNDPGDSKPFGYIDTSGTLVVPTQYVEASDFSEGLARVTDAAEDYPGYFIDKTGARVLGPFFGLPFGFSEGLAYVEWKDGRGFIDKTGNRIIILPDGFGYGSHSSCRFSEGLALVESWGAGIERSVFIDRSGAEIITSNSTRFQDFSEGLAVGEIRERDKLRCGYIDKTGAWVIEPQFDWAGAFSEGLAAVGYFDNGVASYGYVDRTGKMVIPPRVCAGAGPFSGGLAALMGLEGTDPEIPTYIGTTGKVIWQGD